MQKTFWFYILVIVLLLFTFLDRLPRTDRNPFVPISIKRSIIPIDYRISDRLLNTYNNFIILFLSCKKKM